MKRTHWTAALVLPTPKHQGLFDICGFLPAAWPLQSATMTFNASNSDRRSPAPGGVHSHFHDKRSLLNSNRHTISVDQPPLGPANRVAACDQESGIATGRRIPYCVECPRCHLRYLITLGPYRNGSYLMGNVLGASDEYLLYCSCRRPPKCSRWNSTELLRCGVSIDAYKKGYGTAEEIVPIRKDSAGVIGD